MSGPDEGQSRLSAGADLERTAAADAAGGEERGYLADGDEVTLRGYCERRRLRADRLRRVPGNGHLRGQFSESCPIRRDTLRPGWRKDAVWLHESLLVSLLCVGCLVAYPRRDLRSRSVSRRTCPTPRRCSSPRSRRNSGKAVSFAFDNVKERERFGYVPTEDHPRAGLSIEKMTGRQRAAVHDLLKAGLSEKGYMTTDAIMQLEAVLNLIENPPGTAARAARTQSVEVLRVDIRHAGHQEHLGLEARRASRVAELHDCQRRHGLDGASFLRRQSGGDQGRPEEGTPNPRLRRGSRTRAGDDARRGHSARRP